VSERKKKEVVLPLFHSTLLCANFQQQVILSLYKSLKKLRWFSFIFQEAAKQVVKGGKSKEGGGI
jgi:hypothetical protein